MGISNPLDSVFFISLPDNFKLPDNAFQLDPSIPLPVQRPPLQDGEENVPFDISSLTWEMILAGILAMLAYDPSNKNTPYYRSVLLTAKPDIKEEMTEAGMLKLHNNDFDVAEEIFAALRGLDPEDMYTVLDSAVILDRHARFYEQGGLTDDADACSDIAERYYRRVMTAEPSIPDAFFEAGGFYVRQKDYIRAKECFTTFLKITDDTSDAAKNKQEIAELLIKDIEEHSLDDELFHSAYQCISEGDEEKGMEQIKEFLERHSKVWNAWFLLGWALRKQKRWEEAYSVFRQAIECGAENADTYNELSICCLELDKQAECRKWLVKALSLEPENTKIISNLGFLEARIGHPAEAEKYFRTVLEFEPDDPIALNALETLHTGGEL